jgi:hypothetical protein
MGAPVPHPCAGDRTHINKLTHVNEWTKPLSTRVDEAGREGPAVSNQPGFLSRRPLEALRTPKEPSGLVTGAAPRPRSLGQTNRRGIWGCIGASNSWYLLTSRSLILILGADAGFPQTLVISAWPNEAHFHPAVEGNESSGSGPRKGKLARTTTAPRRPGSRSRTSRSRLRWFGKATAAQHTLYHGTRISLLSAPMSTRGAAMLDWAFVRPGNLLANVHAGMCLMNQDRRHSVPAPPPLRSSTRNPKYRRLLGRGQGYSGRVWRRAKAPGPRAVFRVPMTGGGESEANRDGQHPRAPPCQAFCDRRLG